jgi:hypothetical protein
MPERHKAESGSRFSAGYHAAMDAIVINIGWEYFLGIMGSLIAIAYYAQGRFTGLETDVSWLKEMISELTIRAENQWAKLFTNSSPASLTTVGQKALKASGLKSYIDANRKPLLAGLDKVTLDPYELERHTFRLLANIRFEKVVELHLNKFAFDNGISTDFLRRIGAIYLRDIAAHSN